MRMTKIGIAFIALAIVLLIVNFARAEDNFTASFDFIATIYADGEEYEAVAKGKLDFRTQEWAQKEVLEANNILILLKGKANKGMCEDHQPDTPDTNNPQTLKLTPKVE